MGGPRAHADRHRERDERGPGGRDREGHRGPDDLPGGRRHQGRRRRAARGGGLPPAEQVAGGRHQRCGGGAGHVPDSGLQEGRGSGCGENGTGLHDPGRARQGSAPGHRVRPALPQGAGQAGRELRAADGRRGKPGEDLAGDRLAAGSWGPGHDLHHGQAAQAGNGPSRQRVLQEGQVRRDPGQVDGRQAAAGQRAALPRPGPPHEGEDGPGHQGGQRGGGALRGVRGPDRSGQQPLHPDNRGDAKPRLRWCVVHF
mmetsp:Transcript_42383/g.122625  ORF Transcript_42383/g.122625 Transcript_42383/m.122625 type:complete len:256 (+) Transcript_42383:1392-2159(+)